MAKKKDELPDWVSEEIQNARFDDPKTETRTGYILEFYRPDNKVDVQLYEPIEDGRHIVTMDLVNGVGFDDLQRGFVYAFTFDQLKAPLSDRVVQYLQAEQEIDMQAIYRFELRGLELIDESSGGAS